MFSSSDEEAVATGKSLESLQVEHASAYLFWEQRSEIGMDAIWLSYDV